MCKLDDSIEADNEKFTPYTDQQMQHINTCLKRMMDDTYTPEGQLQPTQFIDMSWINGYCKRFIKRKAREFALNGSEAIKVFRKRSSVSAFRIATLCYYLYNIEHDEAVKPTETQIRRRCVQIYNYMAEFIMQGLLNRWGAKFNELNSKREGELKPIKRSDGLYYKLTDTFTRDQLKLLVEQQQLTTPTENSSIFGTRRVTSSHSTGTILKR